MLDPAVTFLNHGSFGSCPRVVLDFQQELRTRMERQPIQFFVRDLEGLLDEARGALARFLHAEPKNLVMVPNATAGVNTVLRSLQFKKGDELLVTNHEYNACRNALDFVAAFWHVRVIVAPIPFPLRNAGQIVEALLRCVTPRTRLALLDHVTSQTGLLFPIEQLTHELTARGIDTLVDGAHAPGMVSVNLRQLNATYYTGNCHKWLCAPKGAGFLYVRRARQKIVRPLIISHGANSPRRDRSRFLMEFGWTGTADLSAYLSVPKAVQYMGSLLPGGWADVIQHNHALAVAARKVICRALNIALPCPDELIASLAAIPIPNARTRTSPKSPLYLDPLQERLLREYNIEVPIIPWPALPGRILRVSAQLYNRLAQYEQLAAALVELGLAA
jgi:isopenicillin-N epimerase